MKTTETVEALLKQQIETLGFELCDVEFAKEYGNWVLTLFVDKEGGVTLDDCELISKTVDPILDQADPIEQSYYLSVSSLGLDRPLKKDRDFARKLGQEVTVRLYAPQDGKKEWIGTLLSYNAASVVIQTEREQTVEILRKNISVVKPYLRF